MAKRKIKWTPKRALWLRLYLDSGNPETFMNATESAIQAGYPCKTRAQFAGVGAGAKRALQPLINDWIDENGLSENALKGKLVELLHAKETKFFAHQGVVMDEREVSALGTQQRALDMALKVKGMYSADKHELSGPGGGPIVSAGVQINTEMDANEAADLYARMIKGNE